MVALGPDGDEVDQEVTIPCVDPHAPIARNVPWLAVPYTHDVARAYLDVLAALAQRATPQVSQTRIASAKKVPIAIPGAAAAALTGSDVSHGVTRRFESIVLVSPIGPYGAWSVTVKSIAAPESHLARDRATLLAIFTSYRVNQQERGKQVAASLELDREGMALVAR